MAKKETKFWDSVTNNLLWIFSIIFLIISIVNLVRGSIISFIFFLLVTLLVNPIIYNLSSKKIMPVKKMIWLRVLSIIIFFIIAVVSSPTNQINQQETQTESNQKTQINEEIKQLIKEGVNEAKKPKPEVEYIEDSLQDLIFLFEVPITDLQRDRLWENNYKDKYVAWNAIVDNVDENLFGQYVILADVSYKGEYAISNDVVIFLKSSEKDKVLELNVGDTIYFKGKLDAYHEMLGNFDVVDAEIISAEEASMPISGSIEHSNQVYREASETGDYHLCGILKGKQKLTCISMVAIALEDLEVCKLLPEELPGKFHVRGGCIVEIAKNINNPVLCEEIKNDVRKNQCEYHFQNN